VSLSARLWQDNAAQVAAVLDHPFVRGLGDGTLPRSAFATYVAQDAFFLEAFARAYALALARCEDRESLEVFADLLTGVRDELRLHESYARRWGVDMRGVEPLPATSAYTDFLLATAAVGSPGLTCAAMTPCMRLYAHIGGSLDAEAAGPYREWVETYADPAFEGLAAGLERLLDRLAPDTPAVAAAYRKAMRLEWEFFGAPLAATPGR
jgi:thiaminase/transcriptional activator TenA